MQREIPNPSWMPSKNAFISLSQSSQIFLSLLVFNDKDTNRLVSFKNLSNPIIITKNSKRPRNIVSVSVHRAVLGIVIEVTPIDRPAFARAEAHSKRESLKG